MYFSKHAIFFVMHAPGHIMSATNLWKCPFIDWLFFHIGRWLAALILDTPLRFYGDLVQVLCGALGKLNACSLLYVSCIYQTIFTENATCCHVLRLGNLQYTMMTSSNGNIFRVTGPLCGQFTGHWWIPLTKASDAELWCFLDLRLE